MGYHRHYKQRDFDFAQQLAMLRRRARLTQEEMALRIGVTGKSIRNWEGGSNYPKEFHLRKLIGLYLDHNVFAPGQEREEACLLWELTREHNPNRIGSFDERWFLALFTQWQTQNASQKPPPIGHQASERPSPTPLPPQEAAKQGTSPKRSWSEAPDVPAWYGRTDELTELEHWLLVEQCRLVVVLGMGGIGKTVLAVRAMYQMADQFEVVIFRSLRDAPSCEELLYDCLQILAPQFLSLVPAALDPRITLLL